MISSTLRTNLAIQAVTFVASVIAARLLGPTGRGEMATVLLYPTLIGWIGLLGIDRVIAVIGGRGELRRPRATIVCLAALLSLPTMVVASVVIALQLSNPQLTPLAWIYVAYIPALHVYMMVVYYFNGHGDFARFNRLRLYFSLTYVTLISCIGFVSARQPVVWVVLANLATWIGCAAFALWWLRRPVGANDVRGELASDLSRIYTLALPFALPAVLTQFSISVYQVVLQQRADTATMGMFVIMFSFSRLIGPSGNAIASHVFRAGIVGDVSGLQSLYRQAVVAFSASAALLLALSSRVVPALFGDGFQVDLATMSLLLLGAVLAMSSDLLAESLKGQARVAREVQGIAANTAIAFSLGWWWTPLSPLVGLAGALACGELVRAALLLWGASEALGTSDYCEWLPSRKDALAVARRTLSLLRNPLR